MFIIFVLSFLALHFANSHFLDVIDVTESSVIQQLDLVLVAGAAAFKRNTMRDRAVVDIMFMWAVWIIATDWVPYFPPIIASIETGILTALIAWVYYRPYHYIPMPVLSDNVCIAFYGGPNAPFLSRIASHFGFPFASIALIMGGKAIRPSKRTGKMVSTDRAVLDAKGYVLIDTGIKVTPQLIGKMNGIVGTPTGYGVFRTKCLVNLLPVLNVLGEKWVPMSRFKIPTFFYAQCVRNIQNVRGH